MASDDNAVCSSSTVLIPYLFTSIESLDFSHIQSKLNLIGIDIQMYQQQ